MAEESLSELSVPQPRKGGFRFPSAVTMLAIVTLLVWVAALFVPAGSYNRDADGSPIPGTYRQIESPLSRGERVEQLVLAPVAAMPDRADRVDDELHRQAMAAGDTRLAGRATAERPALLEQAGSGGTVDGAVHAAAAEQRVVRRVHDGVDGQGRDVGFDGLERCGHGEGHSVRVGWGTVPQPRARPQPRGRRPTGGRAVAAG